MKTCKAVATAVCIAVSCTGLLAGCRTEDDAMYKTYTPSEEAILPLGRTYYADDMRWCAYSGTGAAFTFTGAKAEITIVGDKIAETPDNEANYARIAVCVNEERVVDDQMDQPEKTYTVFPADATQEATVRIVKLSECAMSTIAIKQIAVESETGIRPAQPRPRLIEFVGDSITCGYGVDDEVAEHHFSTATEDVTKAYAYRTAQELEADYSMVSISGYGVLSGYTNNDRLQPHQIVPRYYPKLGFSNGTFGETKPSALKWDFARQPDLVVINLGTNDDSYCQNDAQRQADFAAAYVEFLKTVREKNPQAPILCTLGIMGDRLYPSVEAAAAAYTKETGDTNVSAMKFDVQQQADGYAADWHPTAKTHEKAAARLAEEIRNRYGW